MIRKLLYSIRLWFRPKSSPQLFSYFDGARWRSIDPLAAIYALESHPVYCDKKHFAGTVQGDRESIEAAAGAVCDVFGVLPFNGETGKGLTIGQRIGLLQSFAAYLSELKKNIKDSATSQPSTESISSESGEQITSDT
jgi:hypothetical protein